MATLASHLAVAMVMAFILSQAYQAQATGYVNIFEDFDDCAYMTCSMITESAT